MRMDKAAEDGSHKVSGFLKRALAQTCLRAWYQVPFLYFGHSSRARGRGRPCYGASAPPASHFTRSSLRCAPGTKYVSFEILLGILRAPGEGRGGTPGTVPLRNPKVTSQKACLRNAESSACLILPEFWSCDTGGPGPGPPFCQVRI